MDSSHSHDGSCCNSENNSGVRQTLSEMEFERGIWHAAQSNDVNRVDYLLKKGTPINIEDYSGYTALHYGARNGHNKICKLLLENGANVNALTRSGQATALHRAATQGHNEIAEFLLKSGANPNIRDADGYTALHRAVISNSVPVCKLLLSKTDLKIVDNKGRTPFALAEEKGNQQVLDSFQNISFINNI